MLHQPDLFGATAPAAIPGLAFAADVLAPAEEASLIDRIDAAPLDPFRFHQWEGKRLTASYGWHYDFTAGRMNPAPPLPEWLLPLRERAAAFAGLDPEALIQALVIRYDPGAGIGWHKDRPVFEHVVGISLGQQATMRFRRRTASGFDRVNVPLPPRSIYHLSGEVRHGWEHSIKPMEQPRWSITLRSLAERRR